MLVVTCIQLYAHHGPLLPGNLPVERGILYNKQLVTKFKMTCMTRAPESCKPKVFFHDSKAVVDFSAYEIMERMKKESTGISRSLNRAASLPVYLALKLRQVMLLLSLKKILKTATL